MEFIISFLNLKSWSKNRRIFSILNSGLIWNYFFPKMISKVGSSVRMTALLIYYLHLRYREKNRPSQPNERVHVFQAGTFSHLCTPNWRTVPCQKKMTTYWSRWPARSTNTASSPTSNQTTRQRDWTRTSYDLSPPRSTNRNGCWSGDWKRTVTGWPWNSRNGRMWPSRRSTSRTSSTIPPPNRR